MHLNRPIVGMASTPRGLLAGGLRRGGVHLRRRPFLGSAGSLNLNRPIVGMLAGGSGGSNGSVGSGETMVLPAGAPVTWCETGLPTSPYSSPPAGAVVIPAGDDSGTPPAHSETMLPNTTYWFAPGPITSAPTSSPSSGDSRAIPSWEHPGR